MAVVRAADPPVVGSLPVRTDRASPRFPLVRRWRLRQDNQTSAREGRPTQPRSSAPDTADPDATCRNGRERGRIRVSVELSQPQIEKSAAAARITRILAA